MRVHTIDLKHLGRTGRVAAYLVTGPHGMILVETGPSSCEPVLFEELARLGVEPANIDHVFVTHIHLDHAGAAGRWAQRGAKVFVHPVGAPHLVDPSRLVASATRLYGDLMDELWGEIVPAPEAHIRAIEDGEIIRAAGLEIEALATPGHASHHHVYRIGDLAFTGDVAAMVIPGTDLVEIPTPPPEFDLDLWTSSLARIGALDLTAIYLTHFGRVEKVDRHLSRVATLLEEATELVRSRLVGGSTPDEIEAAFAEWNRARHSADGVDVRQFAALETFSPPGPSVAGILRYLKRGVRS